MADTNQEQLLNEVFRDIRAADDRLSAAGLEPQVMAAWVRLKRAETVRLKPDTTYGRAEVRLKPDTTHRRYGFAVAAVILAVVAFSVTGSKSPPLPAVRTPALPVAAANVAISVPEEMGAVRLKPDTTSLEQTVRLKPDATLVFVPLMPLTPGELSGSFQIVRVQMPRESLGAMASPLEYPNPVVEADVLLGEDGMARAIRVSTGQSIPWRSR